MFFYFSNFFNGVHVCLQGPKCSNVKTAKQKVAFKAIKMLHEAGGLDNHLLPIRYPMDLENIDVWLPNKEENEEVSDNYTQEESVYFTYVRVWPLAFCLKLDPHICQFSENS